MIKKDFEVVIIGGSYAGLSAAMALGRSLREVLVIDSDSPCNRQTPHSHNFITQDGQQPVVIRDKAKEQVLKYKTVRFLTDLAVSGRKSERGFIVETQSGRQFSAKKLIFATGIKDTMPEIPGFAECWGKTVVHCPYCHGYEFRSGKTGILANGARAGHLAGLVHNLTNKLTVLTQGKADLGEEVIAKLATNDIRLVEIPVVGIEHEDGQVPSVIYEDGSREDFDVLYASIPFTQHSGIPAALGCALTEQGYLLVDGFQKTSVDGVYACGDNAGMMRSVASAVHTGNFAGAVINGELTRESF